MWVFFMCFFRPLVQLLEESQCLHIGREMPGHLQILPAFEVGIAIRHTINTRTCLHLEKDCHSKARNDAHETTPALLKGEKPTPQNRKRAEYGFGEYGFKHRTL